LKIFRVLSYINKNTFSLKKLFNRIKVMDEYAKGRLCLRSFPNMIHIEPTNVCNIRCVMCPQPTIMKRKKGFMSMDLYKKVIDELKDTPAEFVYLHQFGESLLHKNLFDMIKYAKRAGLQTGFSTNATILTKENSQKLLDASLDCLILSLDGGSEDIYEKYRLGADWKKVEENCFDFMELRKKYNNEKLPHVVAQTISMKDNENSIDNLYDKFSKYNCSFTNKPFNEWGGKVDEINELSTNDNPTDAGNRQRCEKPYKLLTIEWDGTVVPCTRFFDNQYVYGVFPEKSLREIWNGEAAVNFRKSHLSDRSKVEFCNTCICDGPSFLEQQVLKLMDIMWIEKFIMEVPFVRTRGVANLSQKLAVDKKGKKFQ